MQKSISTDGLVLYVRSQLNNFFPDNSSDKNLCQIIHEALIKVSFNFKHIALSHFYKNKKVYFNHLNADQYTVFIYYASNISYEKYNDINLATKLFLLNKVLHNFHCMYDTKLPDIFVLIHGTGIVLGKAEYADFLVLSQNCNIGANAEIKYPILSKHLILYPNSSIIGECIIGEYCCISNGAFVNNENIKSHKLIISRSPNLIIKDDNKNRFDYFFQKNIS